MSPAPEHREERPSILVSFAYAREWSRWHHLDYWREIVLDSGAYSVAKSGKTIDLGEFVAWVQMMRATAPPGIPVTDVFTLDVIGGDWRQSLANTEELHRRGIDAMPVFHVGEPREVLLSLARDYPKVALGGAVGYRPKMEWAAICFREIWSALGPRKVHGLGYGAQSTMALPFHTIDHSGWYYAPSAFGNYISKGARLPTRNTKNLRLHHEVVHQLEEEHNARRFWAARDSFPELGVYPSIRLATSGYEKEVRSLCPEPTDHSVPLPSKEPTQ